MCFNLCYTGNRTGTQIGICQQITLTGRQETMRSFEELLKENNLADPDDIDALLELAEITRQMIGAERYDEIEALIDYTVRSGYYEAFSWIMASLQEEFDKTDNCALEGFTCFIGRSIANYDEFIRRLQVDLKAIKNDIETISDHNGEIQSFFNILIYRTAYRSVFLISEENFDTKDNDFIRYKLRFTNNLL